MRIPRVNRETRDTYLVIATIVFVAVTVAGLAVGWTRAHEAKPVAAGAAKTSAAAIRADNRWNPAAAESTHQLRHSTDEIGYDLRVHGYRVAGESTDNPTHPNVLVQYWVDSHGHTAETSSQPASIIAIGFWVNGEIHRCSLEPSRKGIASLVMAVAPKARSCPIASQA